jgi:hypothetical protein
MEIQLSRQLRRLVPYLAAAVLLIVGIGVYRAYFMVTPVQQIERLVQRACRAAEAKSILKLSDVLMPDYRDDSGLDRAAVLGEIQQFFSETQNLTVKLVKVVHEKEDLAPTAETARAIVVVQVSGVQQPGGVRFSGIGDRGADAFLVRFAKNRGDWKVASTRQVNATDPTAMQKQLEGNN